MGYVLTGKVNGVEYCFGSGNTYRTALAAGEYNALRIVPEEVGVTVSNLGVKKGIPGNYKHWEELLGG